MTSFSWLSHALSQSCSGANIHLIKRKPFQRKSVDHKEMRIGFSAKTSSIITFKWSHIYCMLASCMATVFPQSWCGISCCFVGYVTMLINNTLLQKRDCIFWPFVQCIMYFHWTASSTQHLNSNTKTAEECSSKHFNVACILFFDKLEPLAVTSSKLTPDRCHGLDVRLWPLMIALTFTLL